MKGEEAATLQSERCVAVQGSFEAATNGRGGEARDGAR
jgi:hypothetical protein